MGLDILGTSPLFKVNWSITAEVGQILVSCEMHMQHLVLQVMQFFHNTVDFT